MDGLDKLKEWIEGSEGIVFFGGAGVSTESGIPDFRSQDGLYNMQYKYPPETMLSNAFFMGHTEEFYEFYRNKMLYLDAKPNKAHLKLAELEKQGKLKAVITQNVDGLHTLAGSVNVLELHGSVLRNGCMRCGRFYGVETVVDTDGVPMCACGGTIKPDVVLYGEGLNPEVLETAADSIARAEVLIVGGTSLNVYPAAGLINYYGGHKLVLINMSATPYDCRADLVIHGRIGEVMDQI